MSLLYILDNEKNVISTDDFDVWGEQFRDNEKRHVASTEIDKLLISTVFLGTDHNIGRKPPLFFETMVFGLPNDEEIQERYCTWEEAEAGHERICEQMRKRRKDNDQKETSQETQS